MRKNLALLTIMLVAVALFAGCRNKPPRIPARPAGLDEVAPGIEATYTTVTTDPNKDDIRYVFDWADGFDTTAYAASGETVSASHAWSDTGWYAVRAKAQDAQGNWTADWSDTHMVRVAFGGGGNPPAAPAAPVGPDTGLVGQYQVFRTWTIDPDNDSVRIQFIWDDGLSSVWSPFVASGDTVTDSVVYSSRGLKNIRAVAMDAEDLMSDTSDSKFHYENQENTGPFKPTVTGPARGIKNGPWYRFYGTAIDPQSDSVQCKFFWGDGNESEWTAFSASGVITMDSWRYPTEGTYNLRCIARDQFGALSETSDVKQFQVVGEGNILWARSYGEEFVSSPALGTVGTSAGDRLACIIGVTSGFMPAIDCYQGEQLYNANEVNNEEFNCSPVVGTNGAVYIGNSNGVLFAYDREGVLKWSWPADTMSGDDIGATPVVDGNNVYVAGENRQMVKLTDNGSSVTEGWRFAAREEIISSPVMTGSNLIVCDDSGYIYSVRSSDGDTNWTYFADSNNISSSPAIHTDGTIYIGTEQGRLIALDGNGGRRWQYEVWPFATITSSPIISADGNWVYFGADNGNLYKLDAGTGVLAPNWPVQVSQAGVPATPTLTADGYLYVQAEDNFLYCVSEAGNVAWSIELLLPGFDGRRSAPRRFGADDLLPSVALDQYGIIYVASGVDGVFAIAGRPAGTLGSGPWPMFHHDVRHTGKFGGW